MWQVYEYMRDCVLPAYLNPDMDFTRDALGKNMGFSRESHEKDMRNTWEKA